MVDSHGFHVGLVVSQKLGDAGKESGSVVALEDEACTLVLIAQKVREGLEDVFLGNNAEHMIVIIDDRENGDSLIQHLLGGFFDKGLLIDGLDVGQHDILNLGLAEQVVELIDGQRGRIGAALFGDQTAGDQANQPAALIDDRKAVKMTLGHDVHSLGDLGIFCNGDRFLCHMIFNVHISLL